jgi:hypothetical protein
MPNGPSSERHSDFQVPYIPVLIETLRILQEISQIPHVELCQCYRGHTVARRSKRYRGRLSA